MRVISCVLIVLAVNAPLAAEPRTATVTIANLAGWPSAGKAISIRLGGGVRRKVAPKRVDGPFMVAVSAPAKPWFDETLIAHRGRLHTLTLTKRGAFDLVMEGN